MSLLAFKTYCFTVSTKILSSKRSDW